MNRALRALLLLLALVPRPSPARPPPDIRINEISALGVGRDWVELYNASLETIDCNPLVLRDSLSGGGSEWPLCIGNLRPGERRVVTCPNFLNGNGEELGLFDQAGMLLDGVIYGRQTFNLTFGRRTDGAQEWCFQYITEREANGTVPPDSPPVIIGAPHHWPLKPLPDEPVFISAAVVAAGGLAGVEILYSIGMEDPPDGQWLQATCRDDGNGEDEAPLDGRFTGSIPGFPADTIVRYRIRAADRKGNETYAPSPEDWFGLHFGYTPPPVRINEIQALNTAVGRYEYGGEFFLCDWIELYNTGGDPIDVSGWYLTDRRTTTVPFPIIGEGSKVIPPGGHLLLWAKRGFPEDALHAAGVNFSLSRNGEEVVLLDEDGFSVVDVVEYPPLEENTSYARIPEGTGEFSRSETPTPQGGAIHPPGRVEVLSYDPLLPELGEPVTVRVWISPEITLQTAQVYHWLLEEDWVSLYNDGTHGDEVAGDEIYTCRMGPFSESGILHFAVEVEAGDGTFHRDPELGADWYRIPLSWRPLGSLKINEVFAGAHLCSCGSPAFQSLTGPLEPRNFVELRNAGEVPVNLKDLWLTDDPLEFKKFPVEPEGDLKTLDPGAVCILWYYGGDERRIVHPEGGMLFLTDSGGILDAVNYGEALPGYSHGIYPQDGVEWSLLGQPSPGELNGSEYFLRADGNADLSVDMGDAIFALFVLFGSLTASCPDSVDIDDTGELDITDPIFLLTYLFLEGPPPPHPFPELGADPTEDGLDCPGYGG